jgi:cytochrome oxidase Cu insertion factor (SCO1/SenC/PrrC family)
VDPGRDTSDILRRYVGSFAERFHILRTTDPAQLKAAEDAFLASSSVKTLDDGEISVSHTATAYVVDSDGAVLVEWPFGIGAKGIENDLRILIKQLKEKS